MADRPTFAEDDGSPDPRLRAALAAGRIDLPELQSTRLLVLLMPATDDPSEMAVVSMVNADGERGLLAFTGLDAMQTWKQESRPVPVTGQEAAGLACDEGATALVIDVFGPARTVIRGAALLALAQRDGDSPGP
jgi:hypothetical protein